MNSFLKTKNKTKINTKMKMIELGFSLFVQ